MKEKFYNASNSMINLNNYIITEDIKNRLYKEKIINFYYFLFKYILKESDIYQIPLFLKSRENILKLIKSNKNKLFISDLDKGLKVRYEYILKKFLDSKYYEKYINDIFYSPQKNKNDRKIQILINNKKNNSSSSNFKEDRIAEQEKLSSKKEDMKAPKGFQKFEIKEMKDLFFNGRILINEEIIALTINDSKKIGKDMLIFYNIKKAKIVKQIEGYFFAQGETSLDLNNNVKYSNLLCLCRKDHKFGLLIIDLDILNNKIKIKKDEEFIQFFPIDFSAESVCCIKNFTEEQNSSNNNIYSNYYLDHEFILLGGERSTIKLYKLKFNEDFHKNKLKYYQNIEIFEINCAFEKSVNYIKQNRENGKIIFRIDEKYDELEMPNLEDDDDCNESFNLSDIRRSYSYREI